VSDIQLADWVQQITGDKAPLKDLRAWEHRIVAAYSELLDGYKTDIPAILNDIAHVRKHPGLVLEQGINFTSLCYHHFLPFFGTVDVAYEPGEVITGLGRIVCFASVGIGTCLRGS
jgi:GTP cyclohydrolase IA